MREYRVVVKGISSAFDVILTLYADNIQDAWKKARTEISGIIDDVYPIDGKWE